mgnify:CR=1 FL=1
MRAKDLRELSAEELAARIQERQDDIIHFRLQQATGVVENVRTSREARREIARIKTILHERNQHAAKGTE